MTIDFEEMWNARPRRGFLKSLLPLMLSTACGKTVRSPEPLNVAYGSAHPTVGMAETPALLEQLAQSYARLEIRGEQGPEPRIAIAAKPATITAASATIIDARGYLITAAHVATSVAFEASVTTLDGVVRPARVLDVSPERELALVAIRPFPGMTPALFRRAPLEKGLRVLALGTPATVEESDAAVRAIDGTLLDPQRDEPIRYGRYGFARALELAIAVGPGYSGGPVFDREGRLIGMIAGFGLGDTSRVPYRPPELGYAVGAAEIADYIAETLADAATLPIAR